MCKLTTAIFPHTSSLQIIYSEPQTREAQQGTMHAFTPGQWTSTFGGGWEVKQGWDFGAKVSTKSETK